MEHPRHRQGARATVGLGAGRHTGDVTDYTYLRRDDLLKGGVLSLHRIDEDTATAATWSGVGWVTVPIKVFTRLDDMAVTQITEAEARLIIRGGSLLRTDRGSLSIRPRYGSHRDGTAPPAASNSR